MRNCSASRFGVVHARSEAFRRGLTKFPMGSPFEILPNIWDLRQRGAASRTTWPPGIGPACQGAERRCDASVMAALSADALERHGKRLATADRCIGCPGPLELDPRWPAIRGHRLPGRISSTRFRAGRPLRDGFETTDRRDTRQERLRFRPSFRRTVLRQMITVHRVISAARIESKPARPLSSPSVRALQR
jgi:hypothetical protein